MSTFAGPIPVPLGLTGATAATRYVGGTASTSPASGTFAVGDFVVTQTGHVYVCTVAGSPGTWVDAGGAGGAVSSVFTRSGAVVAANGDYYGVVAAALTGVTGGAARFVGSLAVGAAPASGTFLTGDFTVNQDGTIWICTAGGTQGTWKSLVAGSVTALAITNAMISASAAIAISKLADPGSGKVVGSTGSGAIAVVPPGFKWDSAVRTVTLAITATTEGTAQACLVGNSITYDGTEVRIECSSPEIDTPTAGSFALVFLRDAAVLGQVTIDVTTGLSATGGTWVTYDTPSAGAHTYSIAAFVSTGTGAFGAGVGGSTKQVNATMRVTKT